ncbi:hypothetical protein ACFXNW_15980 [Nocardia sp. NPDC059180]|uniref:hypothetical protein n=1 Tax=Nocardia sp. NPDC059180 TaxID=3346761 RepID=UPI0036AD0C1E
MNRPDWSAPPTYEEALDIARSLAADPDTLTPYRHQELETARYGRGFAFLQTIRNDHGNMDGYVLVATTAHGSGVLLPGERTIDAVIAEHLARAEHANRDIPDSELSVAHRVALEAYDIGLTCIDELPGRRAIDAETADYAAFVLIVLLRNHIPGASGRNILARNDSLMRSPTPGRRHTQPCPRCERPAIYLDSYPRAVCDHCRGRTTDRTGRPVTGFNTHLSGGMIAYYTDMIERSDGSASPHEECVEVTRTGACLIDGHPATMQEARFGGIVVQTAPDY